jgi:hypothetical protein
MNWQYLTAAAGLIYIAVLAVFIAKRQWTWSAMGVAIGNFLYVLLHLAAPFRGVIDPNYVGYSAGLLTVAAGPMVTIVTGGIVIAALASACIALLNRPGPRMAFITITDTLLLSLIALPSLLGGLKTPDEFRIELGEYLQIPGAAAVLIVGSLFVVPMVAGITWSARRVRPVLGH